MVLDGTWNWIFRSCRVSINEICHIPCKLFTHRKTFSFKTCSCLLDSLVFLLDVCHLHLFKHRNLGNKTNICFSQCMNKKDMWTPVHNHTIRLLSERVNKFIYFNELLSRTSIVNGEVIRSSLDKSTQ